MIRMNACAASRPRGPVGPGHLACGAFAGTVGPRHQAGTFGCVCARGGVDRPTPAGGCAVGREGREPAVGGVSGCHA